MKGSENIYIAVCLGWGVGGGRRVVVCICVCAREVESGPCGIVSCHGNV